MPKVNLSNELLKHQWYSDWPDLMETGPLSDEYTDRWVRFHNLPQSKRWPENEREYAIILARQYKLLAHLGITSPFLLVTSEWTETPDPGDPFYLTRRKLESRADHWLTIFDDPAYRQVYISQKAWRPNGLDKILRAVANDEIAKVIIVPKNLEWVFMPYDGGVDIILPNTHERDELKDTFPEWLSDREDGL